MYSQKTCFNMCYYEYLSDLCNCSFSNNHDHCFQTECFSSEYTEGDFQFDAECRSDCPLECTSKALKITQDIAVYSEYKKFNRAVFEKLNQSEIEALDNANFRNGAIELNVFFNNFIYSEKIEIPKISNIYFVRLFGCQIGLFLAISFMSFLEIIDLIKICVLIVIRSIQLKILGNAKAIIIFI